MDAPLQKVLYSNLDYITLERTRVKKQWAFIQPNEAYVNLKALHIPELKKDPHMQFYEIS